MRIQVTVDDELGHELQEKAKELGLSISAYARSLLKQELNILNKALLEESEEISLAEFQKNLEEVLI